MSTDIRKNIFIAAYAAGVGHLASAFSLVEILSALYLDGDGGVMRHNPQNPEWAGRDFLILSKGHGSLALYAVLAQAGYFDKDELFTFCQPGTRLGGEPHALECPGVEVSTGSLGHGLSVGMGMALTLKADGKPNRVYVVLGDGECQEGSVWEAVMTVPKFELSNLTVIIDHNRLQKMNTIETIIGKDDLGAQFAAFGWDVKEADGHDILNLQKNITDGWTENKPRCLIANTTKGKGVSLMEDNPAWHWRMPNRKERKVFMEELGITQEELDEIRGNL